MIRSPRPRVTTHTGNLDDPVGASRRHRRTGKAALKKIPHDRNREILAARLGLRGDSAARERIDARVRHLVDAAAWPESPHSRSPLLREPRPQRDPVGSSRVKSFTDRWQSDKVGHLRRCLAQGAMDWRSVAKVRNMFNASHNDVAAIIWRNEWCWRVGPYRLSTSPT